MISNRNIINSRAYRMPFYVNKIIKVKYGREDNLSAFKRCCMHIGGRKDLV